MRHDTNGDRIIVGVDGSEPSITALRYAARLADALDAPLEAVNAWSEHLYPDTAIHVAWDPETDARAMVDATLRRAFGKTRPERLTSTVIPGPAARTLIEESKRAAMLVVGSRGKGGFAGLRLGSVSSACAAHGHCPVLVVHPRASE